MHCLGTEALRVGTFCILTVEAPNTDPTSVPPPPFSASLKRRRISVGGAAPESRSGSGVEFDSVHQMFHDHRCLRLSD